ncbi:metalloprotease TldD [Acidithiobacillus ferrooxidans F221]|uniref:metalloprotease TldD n=1 Tax=Acidithiobacillus ferrooxidans TaxID=920 RepID=UPI001C073CEB|nr:metalloprotease TldD [Acidithiobacillus ferrooxidans]MBU2806894.1 metalloprotease TldD [Acidithiobacillus ferrooxidans F221]
MTASALEIARATLFAPGGISEGALEKVFGRLSHRALDDADLYFQYSRSEGFSLEEGVVKSGSHSIEQGVGVRAVSGERQGLAYSDEIAVDALLTAADAARAIVHRPGQAKGLVWQQRPGLALYPPVDPLASISNSEKIALLERVERAARACDPRIVQVMASLNARFEAVLVARLDGTMAADVRPLVRLNVSAIAEQGGRREQGSAGGGGRYDYQTFLQGDMAEGFAREAARQALVNLAAEAAPAGTMEVVLGPGWPGVLLHEAIGHGLEGDFNRKGTSAFSGRVGQRVAAPGVTVVDDGTLDGRRGSLNVDDEGTPTQCTTLIEDGILKGYLQDTLNARLTGTRSTGNGRRESYAHLPMPRMTNTYMRAGDRDPREIIASVKRGLYAVNFGGGQVDITNGKFVFSASEAYLIENGKITRPVKGATLIGNGPDVLTRVEMIGNDLQMDTGVGTCGKDGQSVPVGVGQPTLKIRDLTVGGTQG